MKFHQNDNGTYYPQILVIPESREYKTIITPIDASDLDRMDIIEAVTMYISYVPWERKGSSGVGLWLRQAAFIIREDPFAARYREIPIYGRDQNEWLHFKDILDKYQIFENLNPDYLIDRSHFRFYPYTDFKFLTRDERKHFLIDRNTIRKYP